MSDTEPEYTVEDFDHDVKLGGETFRTGVATVLNMEQEPGTLLWELVNSLDEDEMAFTLFAGIIDAANLVKAYKQGTCGGCTHGAS